MADTKDLREMYFGRGMGRQRPAPTSISEAASRLAETVTEPMQALMNAGAGFLRGSTAGTLGAPADILNLLRVKQLGGKDIPYGYEYFDKVLPSAGPSQEAKVYGTLGQFVALPSRVATAPLKAVAAIPGAIKHGATEFAKASALGAPHVMRTRGSQTIDFGPTAAFGSLTSDLRRFYRRQNPEETLAKYEDIMARAPESFTDRAGIDNEMSALRNEVAIKNWVQGPLAKYIKRDMGTPEDPVRLLAEEGITHTPFSPEFGRPSVDLRYMRGKEGYPEQGVGVSPEARRYETMADYAVGEPYITGRPETAETLGFAGRTLPDWMAKLPEDTRVFAPRTTNMGFEHIVDVLREDLAAGRIRPEQVSKISMEQAVRRTHQYDQELAAKMDAEKAAFRSGLPVHKEYKTGYKWVELNKPGAFAAESDAMGHSVRGYEPPKGHPDWVEASGDSGSYTYGHGGWDAIKKGRAKVYSLIDDQGRPHATVEVKTGNPRDAFEFYLTENQASELAKSVRDTHFGGAKTMNDIPKKDWPRYSELIDQAYLDKYGPPPSRITQIKGKQNTRPVDEYQPYIADFVRSGEWEPAIGDFRHTDLVDVGGKRFRQSELQQLAKEHGAEFDAESTPVMVEWFNTLTRDYPNIDSTNRGIADAIRNFTPPEFAEGGSVQSLRSLYFGS